MFVATRPKAISFEPVDFWTPPPTRALPPGTVDLRPFFHEVNSTLRERIETLPLLAGFPIIGSYEEITRRIPAADRDLIEAFFIRHAKKLLALSSEACELLTKGSLDELHRMLSSSFNVHTVFISVLFGLKQGHVSPQVFFRFAELISLEDPPIYIVDPLLEEDCLYLDVENYLRENLSRYCSDEQIEKYLSEFKKLPRENRVLFVHSLSELELQENTITTVIKERARFEAFHPDLKLGVGWSFSDAAYQLFLDIVFGKNAVIQNPVLGLSTTKQIAENGLTGTRDIGYGYVVPIESDPRNITFQKKIFTQADNHPAANQCFRDHDRYHAFLSSGIPQSYRTRTIVLAYYIRLLGSSYFSCFPHGARVLQRTGWNIEDMEFPSFTASLIKARNLTYIHLIQENAFHLKRDDNPSYHFIHSLLQKIHRAAIAEYFAKQFSKEAPSSQREIVIKDTLESQPQVDDPLPLYELLARVIKTLPRSAELSRAIIFFHGFALMKEEKYLDKLVEARLSNAELRRDLTAVWYSYFCMRTTLASVLSSV